MTPAQNLLHASWQSPESNFRDKNTKRFQGMPHRTTENNRANVIADANTCRSSNSSNHDQHVYRFWKASAGSLRLRQGSDIPDIHQFQNTESVEESMNKFPDIMHNLMSMSEMMQCQADIFDRHSPQHLPSDCSGRLKTTCESSAAPVESGDEVEERFSVGQQLSEVQSIEHLLSSLDSIPLPSDRTGTPAPLAAHETNSNPNVLNGGLHSGKKELGDSPTETSRCSQNDYDSESTASFIADSWADSDYGSKEQMGYSFEYLRDEPDKERDEKSFQEGQVLYALSDKDASLEDEESGDYDCCDNTGSLSDTQSMDNGEQTLREDQDFDHTGFEVGDSCELSDDDDELFDYYTTIEERMRKFSVLLGNDTDSKEQNANPVEVYEERSDAQKSPVRELISPERLRRHRNDQLRKSAVLQTKVRNADSILAQHRQAGGNARGNEQHLAIQSMVPLETEPKMECCQPLSSPSVPMKTVQRPFNDKRGSVYNLISPSRLRDASKLSAQVLRPTLCAAWRTAAKSLDNYDFCQSVSMTTMDKITAMDNKNRKAKGKANAATNGRESTAERNFGGIVQISATDSAHFQRGRSAEQQSLALPSSTQREGQARNLQIRCDNISPWSSERPSYYHATLSRETEENRREMPSSCDDQGRIRESHDNNTEVANFETKPCRRSWLDTRNFIPGISHDDENLDLQAITSYNIPNRDIREIKTAGIKESELQPHDIAGINKLSTDSYAIPCIPQTSLRIVPSRSKAFDSADILSGGHRSRPELHSAMSASQLREVLNQYLIQAAEFERNRKISANSSNKFEFSPARRESRHHMRQFFNEGHSVEQAMSGLLGAKEIQHTARSPEEMLLRALISGQISEQVMISNLQRQSRDIQDLAIKMFSTFTARCAPQTRCQIAAVCAVADMTAFANLLVTSKLEVAEQMLLHPPLSHDEVNLLSCNLALEWGKKQKHGSVKPTVEDVLQLIYKCMSQVNGRMDDQKERLQQMRLRRGNAAALYQASQRVMLGAISGMFELELQISELVMNMVSCSKFFLVGYNSSEKSLYIRGTREDMDHHSAMATSIVDRTPIHIQSLEDERLTENDIRRILSCYRSGLRIRNLLIVPILHKRGTDRSRCVGLMVVLNKKVRSASAAEDRRTGEVAAFQDADKVLLRKAGAILSPAIIAAMRHTSTTITQREIAHRSMKAQRIIEFCSNVHQSLDPSEMWRSVMEEAPSMLNCARVVLYIYVENGIVAVQNPESEMLEFLTIEEAGIAGEMFNARTPKYISTRTHAVNENPSSAPKSNEHDMNKSSVHAAGIHDPSSGMPVSDTAKPATFDDFVEEQIANTAASSSPSSVAMLPELVSEKRPESRDSDWNPQDSDENLSTCLTPEPSILVYSLLLAPLRQRVSTEEAKRLHAHLKREKFAEYSDDSDDDYEGGEARKETEVTWAVLVAMNKELTREQEDENMLGRQIKSIRTKAMETANNRQGWKRGRSNRHGGIHHQGILPEFCQEDEVAVDTIGRIVYPAMVNAQVQTILHEHLGNLG